MQNLKTNQETTSSNLSKEDLKTLLISKQDKIKKLVSEVHTNKKITLSVSLSGEYMISTARKRLSPSSQANITPTMHKNLILPIDLKMVYQF